MTFFVKFTNYKFNVDIIIQIKPDVKQITYLNINNCFIIEQI